MGFNSGFKGLIGTAVVPWDTTAGTWWYNRWDMMIQPLGHDDTTAGTWWYNRWDMMITNVHLTPKLRKLDPHD